MSEKKLTREADTSTLYEFKGSVPKPSLLVPLSLQHVLAAVVGVITPSIIIAGVCGLTESEKTMMIQAALLLTAIATLLQLFPIFNRLGAGLPVIMGTSFAYVPTLQAIGGEFDMGTILGAEIIGVNNRNLVTFETDINTSLEMSTHFKDKPVYISESAIFTGQDAALVAPYFNGILVGTALMTADNVAEKVKELQIDKG